MVARFKPAAATLLLLVGFASLVSGSTPEGEAWLAANAQKEGVIVHPSGLQYKARARATCICVPELVR